MVYVKQFISALLDVILPPVCHICHSFIPNAEKLHICPGCREKLPQITSPICSICGIPFNCAGGDHCCSACLTDPPHYDSARAALLYDGAVRDMIHSFKYNRRRHLCQPLSLLAIERMSDFLHECKTDIIVPVPLHRTRLRQRGFNQAVLLGSKMSRGLGIPMLPDVLARTRKTEPQVELSASERRLNVKDAFSVKKHQMLTGKRIMLLDDVITTGSTMNECAKELKKAGAEIVIALTIARTAR